MPKLLTAPRRTWHIELKLLQIQNAKTSSAILKRGEYIENEKHLPSLFRACTRQLKKLI